MERRGGRKSWNTKYNYGIPIDTSTLDVGEYQQCAKEWSEGDKNLEELLYTCLTNKIKTHACCSGHNGEKPRIEGEEDHWNPYISFILNKKNGDIIDMIVTRFKSLDGIKISYISEKKNETPARVTLSFPRGTNTEVFKQINEICKGAKQGEHFDKDETFTSIRTIIQETEPSKPGYQSEIYYRKGKTKDELRILGRDDVIDTLSCEGTLNNLEESDSHFLIIPRENKKLNDTIKGFALKKHGESPYKTYYAKQNQNNQNSIRDMFKKIKDEYTYTINDESLEKIAKRPKKISVKNFFNGLVGKIRRFINPEIENKKYKSIDGE